MVATVAWMIIEKKGGKECMMKRTVLKSKTNMDKTQMTTLKSVVLDQVSFCR